MTKVNLITLCSEDYLFYAQACVKSFSYYYPEFLIDIYFLNVAGDHRKKFSGLCNNITIHDEPVHFRNIHEKRNYCTNRRNYLLYNHLNQSANDDICIWVDADSICNKRDEKWLEILGSNDVVIFGKNMPLGGIIGVRNTGGGRIFSKLYFDAYPQSIYTKSVPSAAGRIWMLNQNVLKTIIHNPNNRFTYTFLSHPFYDTKCREDSFIWLPATEKAKQSRFKIECQRWVDKGVQ